MPERAIIYMRKSVEDEDSHSFDFQESDCRAHARKSGYSIVAAVSDPGMTGHDSLDTRPIPDHEGRHHGQNRRRGAVAR